MFAVVVFTKQKKNRAITHSTRQNVGVFAAADRRPAAPSAGRRWSCSVRGHIKASLSPSVSVLQIHAHYELKKTSRHRRNLAITGGVALSIITAPVIAAVSVGKNLGPRPFVARR